MHLNPKLRGRRSIRLKGYDYQQAGLYFITLCCYRQRHLFGHIKKDIMCLNTFGSIAWDEWQKTPAIRKNIKLHEFIVMPNHIHGIIEIKETSPLGKQNNIGKFHSPSQTVGAFVRGYKGATTKRIKAFRFNSKKYENLLGATEGQPGAMSESPLPLHLIPTEKSIWQRDYYEHIIRDRRAYHNISNYIRNNPRSRQKDKFMQK